MRLIENSLWQLLDQGIGRGLLFLFYLAVPLAIGVEEYGRFAFVQAAVGLAVQPAILLGLDLIVIKRIARGEAAAFRDALLARVVLFAATGALVTLIGAAVAPADLGLVWLLWLYYGLLALQGLIFAHFRALEQMRIEGVVGALQKALALPALAALALGGACGATAPAAILAFTAGAGLVLLPILYWREIAPLVQGMRHTRLRIAGVVSIAREGFVTGLAAFAGLAYFRIDSVLLGIFLGNGDVGIYNVAHRIMEATLIVPAIGTTVVFPRVARSAGASPTLGWTTFALATIGIAVSISFYFGGAGLIALIYGPGHAASGAVLAVLALAIAPTYAGYALTQALVAADRQRAYLRLAVRALALNLGLNLVLIPSFGATGAAAAAVATEIAVVAMAAAALR
ncbi:MAG TPA: oligosaccharide flippase family protein [Candidatus Dormibacteraeota bacterium]|nr:oligosaccharide flippase family protein [Candidatus Dormibacteraeota bacterium]